MAICPGCGKDIRDDIWVCGHCGELVARGGAGGGAQGTSAGAGGAAYGSSAYGGETYGGGEPYAGGSYAASAQAGYGAPAPLTSAPAEPSRGGSHAVLLAGVLGIVAVAAIVAVWFFVLRGGGGDFSTYVGQWQLTVPGSTAGLAITITDSDGDPELTMGTTGTYAGQDMASQAAGPYKMELDDGNLVSSLEASDDASEEQKMAADVFREAFGAVVDDFRMVFTPGSSADTLSLTFEGDVQGSPMLGGGMSSQAVILNRVQTGTSQLY
jgi:hypothetical protein